VASRTAGNGANATSALSSTMAQAGSKADFRCWERLTLTSSIRSRIRPTILQDWLDQKLLEIIERLVKAELSRAIGELPRFAS